MAAAAVRADLHVHVGFTRSGRPVKIPAGRDLTLSGILERARSLGIDAVGLVDSAVASVTAELAEAVREGELRPVAGGGLMAGGGPLLLLGHEVEVRLEGRGVHFLLFFEDLSAVSRWQLLLRPYVGGLFHSTPVVRGGLPQLLELGALAGSIPFPAHAFTPHKGIYAAVDSLRQQIPNPLALEMGLSSDTHLADRLAELAEVPFLASSDAHSLGQMGREFTDLLAEEVSFRGVLAALQQGRIRGYTGLPPALGKYHRSACPHCGILTEAPPLLHCPRCGGKVVMGVLDRIVLLAGEGASLPGDRPSYRHQVPLRALPGMGPATLARIAARWPREEEVLWRVPEPDLLPVLGVRATAAVMGQRLGRLHIFPGGGGGFGRVEV